MPLWDRIAELLSLPVDGAGAPTIEGVEATWADGYAAALAIDAERWRIERRLGDSPDKKQIARLSKRLETADRDLAQLRPLLRSLPARARATRRARAA